MNEAMIHRTEEIVTAKDVFDGKISRYSDFVDVEYKFRVTYVKCAKNSGNPYFRLYYTIDYYRQMTPERKTKYDILRSKIHFRDSLWHRTWELNVSHFARLEKVIRNSKTNQCKRADAFYETKNVCFEFQHSYIKEDFNERNAFYSELGIKVIWLYDLTNHEAKKLNDGSYEILEDNSNGFFRIAEYEKNLEEHNVFVQMMDKKIYRVSKLERRVINDNKESTIRYFYPDVIYDEVEFINSLEKLDDNLFERKRRGKTIYELWNDSYSKMVVKNIENNDQIVIYSSGKGMNYDFSTMCIQYQYVEFIESSKKHFLKSKKFYNLSDKEASSKKWILLNSYAK